MRRTNVSKERLKILVCLQELAKIGEQTLQEVDKNLAKTENVIKSR